MRLPVTGCHTTTPKTCSAAEMVRRSMLASDALETLPEFGSVGAKLGYDHLRVLQVGPYRVIYAVAGETCTVAAVLHVRQDVTSRIDPDDFIP